MGNHIRCRVCNSENVSEFLHRKETPVHQNLLMKTRETAKGINRGDLSLIVCNECGFIFNQSFDISKLQYGSDYNNNQACSPTFNKYMNDLVDTISTTIARKSKIIEVGSGNGEFLKRLIYNTKETMGYGFDPAYKGPNLIDDERITFVQDFYDGKYADIAADVVISRHVIEHIPDPMELLRSIRKALISSSKPKIYFETPCVEWILEHKVLYDFFYEHCSYFSKDSLASAFRLAGFKVDKVEHIFEGQYLWIEATVTEEASYCSIIPNSRTAVLASVYAESLQTTIINWREQLKYYKQSGNIVLWGAGAKGATFANLLDPECSLISCVIDINPEKQSKFLPGTGHPIVGYQYLNDYEVETAILMNPNYRKEIELLLKNNHIKTTLVELEQTI